MKSAILLLLISSSLLINQSEAAGYTDKSGNPAPNPCNSGENVYFDTLIFNCIDGKKVYYGCKVNNAEVQQDTAKDENNLRTLYCHKDGNSVKTVVTGCVTDDNQFINETKTVKQVDGIEFACTKEANGFSFVKRSPPTKVSDCTQGETKVVGSRYLLQCYEESAGYFTFKLAACYSTLDDEKTRVEVTKSLDDYVNADKQLGFRYSCHAEGNIFYYEPIACLLGAELITPGNFFQNGSLTVMCMRDGRHRLRLRPVYSSEIFEKTCTSAMTYIERDFKYECQAEGRPKPVGCVFFKNQKEIPIDGTYNDDKAYQYKCEQTSDSKHLALVKVACLDDENQILVEGGKKTFADGSRIECQKSDDDGLLRMIVAGKEEHCNEGGKVVKDYLQYQCQNQQPKPFACAPHNNDSLIIEIGKTYNSDNYQYKCEQQGKTIIYHAIACLDMDKRVIQPEQKRLVKIFTYECQRKANNELALVISNEKGCQHPTSLGKLIRPNDTVEVSRTISNLGYKSMCQCVAGGDKGYYLIDVGCKVDGKKYDIGNYVAHQQDIYKCARLNAGEVYLINVPVNELACRYGNKVYKNGETFNSTDGISQYQCDYGTIVKMGCFVFNKRIPAGQLMYSLDEPYYCFGKGDGVIRISLRGCLRKPGQLMTFGENFNEKDIVYSCTYTQYDNIFKPVIVPVGCVYGDKVIPINSYIFYQNKNIVCEVDKSFTVIVHPATPQQEDCIAKTATYNCQSNDSSIGEGGSATAPPSSGEFTATPGNGSDNTGNPGSGTTKPGSGNNNGNDFPTDSDGNPVTTKSPGQDLTATLETGGHNGNGQGAGTTKSGNGGGNEIEFPPDDGTATTSTSPSDHTATGESGNNNPNDPQQGTTKSSGGNDNENPFPTDDSGNPITKNPNGNTSNAPSEHSGNTHPDVNVGTTSSPRRTCNSTEVVTSYAAGDPHYKTFDGLNFDYHGTCPHVFLQPCTFIKGYESFAVKIQNRKLPPSPYHNFTLTVVDSVNIEFYGQMIYVDAPGNFYVNEKQHDVPYYYPSHQNPKISVERKEQATTTIKTIDRIDFTINHNSYIDNGKKIVYANVFVSIPNCPEFFGPDVLCGLAGNYDKNWTNDVLFRNGTKSEIINPSVVNSWGDDWITTDYFTPSSNDSSECFKAVNTNVSLNCANGEVICKPIKDALNGTGVFAPCKQLEAAVINSQYLGCVTDVCTSPKFKCPDLEAFVILCQRKLNGTSLTDWRTPLECPKECPENTTYNVCVPNCQPSCTDPLATKCPSSKTPCVEGCQCSVGYVQDQSKMPYRCIKQNDCPPIPTSVPEGPDGATTTHGSGDNNPDSPSGTTPGEPSGSPSPDENVSTSSPPRRKCNSTKVVTSGLWGDPHFWTFDGSRYGYHGTCPYIFLQPCTFIKGYENFSVKVKNMRWLNTPMATLESANIEFYGQVIYFDLNGNFYVNEKEHGFPYYYPSQQNPKLSVERKDPSKMIVKTFDRIDITFSLQYHPNGTVYYMDLSVSIPDCPEFFGPDVLCGLAGNYDNNCTNDVSFRNGTKVIVMSQPDKSCVLSENPTDPLIDSWAEDWLANDYFTPTSNGNKKCSKGVDTNVSTACANGKEACKLIKDASNETGAFAPCKQLGDAVINLHYDGCVSDVCTDANLRCPNLGTFGILCQNKLNGTTLSDWRTSLGCPMKCPENTTYNVCVPSCQPSCMDPLATNCPSSKVSCVEGCQCSVGYVQDQSKMPYRCIKQSDCPSLPTLPTEISTSSDGNAFPTDESGNPITKSPDHTASSDVFSGTTSSGGPENEGTISPPQTKCNTTKVVVSGLWDDPHYYTFDGSAHDYQGLCPHVFLRPCTSIKGYEYFSIKIKNLKWLPLPILSAMESANIEFYGQKIYVDNLANLYINEIKHEFPYYYPSQQNPKISVERKEQKTITIKTIDRIDFRMQLKDISERWKDGNMNYLNFEVSIPDCPEFFGSDKLCGVAGNYDKNCTNDLKYRNGTNVDLEENSAYPCKHNSWQKIHSWADDWITNDYYSPFLNNTSKCINAVVDRNVSADCVAGKESCKPIKDALNGTGIFAPCKQLGDTAINLHFDGCVFDVCADPNLKCPELETFGLLCQRQLNGTALSDWRTTLECPMQCPANTTYNICVPDCQPSCTDPLGTKCPPSKVPCVEGCQCSVGYVQDQSKMPYRCIKQSDCPPIPTTVPGGNTVTSTPEGHEQDSTKNPNDSGGNTQSDENGSTTSSPQKKCNSTKVVTSGLWGDPHCWTFDGSQYSYHGTCPYVFLQPCTTIKGYENFSVKVKNRQWLNTPMAALESANIEFYGQVIYFDLNETFYVNKIKREFPYYYPSQQHPKLSAERKDPSKMIVKTIDQIDITFDLHYHPNGTIFYMDLNISIPDCADFFGPDVLCGLAGNYDNNCTNDVSFRNRTKVIMMPQPGKPCALIDYNLDPVVNSWGNDWITSDYFTPLSNDRLKCSEYFNTNVSISCDSGKEACKPIKDASDGTGTFALCKQLEAATINSQYMGCVSDVCTDANLKCPNLETFGLLCQRQLNGKALSDWRTALECPKHCPANTTYNICVPDCQPSCTDSLGTKCPPSKVPCVEGCQCSVGYVQDQSKMPYHCIKQNDCPPIPTTVPGRITDTTGYDGATTTSGLSGNTTDGPIGNTLSDENVSTTSPPERKCNSTKVVSSWAWGDPHYKTFDGFQFSYHGTCPHVFLQPCTSIKGYEHFSVKIKNIRVTEGVYKNLAAVESANIEIYGQKIYIDGLGNLYVNEVKRGIPYYYPSQQNPKLSVEKKDQVTTTIKTIDQIDFLILLVDYGNINFTSFSVSIPDCPEFFGPDVLCGLAGNYDNNCTNDVSFRNGTKSELMDLNHDNPCWCNQSIVNSWGNDWITSDYFILPSQSNSECIKGVDTNVSSDCVDGKDTCKPIKDALDGRGIFAPCKQVGVATINSQYMGCVTDVCMSPKFKCPDFETFGLLCQRQLNGTALSDWRTSLECPMQCPANTTYNICVPDCQPSCTDPLGTKCPPSKVPCVEGCQCSVGYVQDQSKMPYRCIKQSDCPPIPTTVPGGNTDPTDEAHVSGGTTSNSHEQGSTTNPNGTGGNTHEVPGGNTQPDINAGITYYESLNIEFYGQKIYIDGHGNLYVNEKQHVIPYYYPSQQNSKISVEKKDQVMTTIKTIDRIDFTVQLRLTGIVSVPDYTDFSVSIPDCPEFFGPNVLCGLAGNYDNNCTNDAVYRNGTKIDLEQDSTSPCGIWGPVKDVVNSWGNDWITNDYFDPFSNDSAECHKGVETNISTNCASGEEACKPIQDALDGTGAFAPCKQLGDAVIKSRFEGCVSDVCISSHLKCPDLEAFGFLCQRHLNGTMLSDWRTPIGCLMECPENTTYNICVPDCQSSCTDPLATKCPSSKVSCVEGCQCSAGFVQDQSKMPYHCIKQSDCPPISTTVPGGITDTTNPGGATTLHGPGGSTSSVPGQITDQPPPDHGSTVVPNPPQKCEDLLRKNVCKQLQPFCLSHSFRKAVSTLADKADRDSLMAEIENSKGNIDQYLSILQNLVIKGAYPEEAITKIKLPATSDKETTPGANKTIKANCIALQEQCHLNTDSSACANYIAQCSNDLNVSVCKTTTCTTTKEFDKTITAEIISKLCPESCLVPECYNNAEKPGELDIDNLIAPGLLTCFFA